MKFELGLKFLNTMSLLPFLWALCAEALMLATIKHLRLQKILHLLALVILFLSSLALLGLLKQAPYWVTHFGNWPAPFGITFVIDNLSVGMILLMTLICGITGWYALYDIDALQFQAGFLPAFWFLVIGMLGSVMTGDLFNLYVWFEMMLISSFILMGLGKPRRWLINKFKYVILNLTGTLLLLSAIALIYGMTGTLNMADIAEYMRHTANVNLSLTLMLFLLVGLGIKSAIFPVFSWLPASYHTTSATASALMGGILSKIGIYVIIRVFTLIYPLNTAPIIVHLLLIIAGFTMVIGVLGAAAEYNYRRILSFHIISQIGYMILGIALNTPGALAATLFFMAHNILTKTSLFLTGGVAKSLTRTSDIREMGGLYRETPGLAILFLISALALAGMPPLLGFWAKLLLITASFKAQEYVLAMIAIIVSMLTLYSMMKIWNYAYLSAKAKPRPKLKPSTYKGLMAPVALLVMVILYFSLLPTGAYDYCLKTAYQLNQPEAYIEAVLGKTQ